MTPKISLKCGSKNDLRTFNFQFDLLKRKIGVLVSGGLDSALLYYLVQSLANEKYSVVPFIINRDNDGSDLYAQPVIDFIHKSLNKPSQTAIELAINEKNSDLQVSAGMKLLDTYPVNIVYIGLIETLPIHSIGVAKPFTPVDNNKFVYPFKNLNKSHIVDLVNQLDLHELFKITHSCVYKNYRCNHCNRCNERHWAFTKLNLVDPGTR